VRNLVAWKPQRYLRAHFLAGKKSLSCKSDGGPSSFRVEFEASVESEAEEVSIMDEDEWTDRNNIAGNSLHHHQTQEEGKKRGKNKEEEGAASDTSDDALSDLETDTDEEEKEAPESR